MFQTIVSILPLDAASALSPVIFAITIFLLSSTYHRKIKILSFLAGALVVGIFTTLIGFYIGSRLSIHDKTNPVVALLDLTFGTVFLYFAIRSLLSKNRKMPTEKHRNKHTLLRWISIGILVNVTNFDAVMLNLTAAKIIGAAQHLSDPAKIVLFSLNMFFFTLPVTLPVFFQVAFPIKARLMLSGVKFFLLAYARYITAILFFIFGIVFINKGIQFFLPK